MKLSSLTLLDYINLLVRGGMIVLGVCFFVMMPALPGANGSSDPTLPRFIGGMLVVFGVYRLTSYIIRRKNELSENDNEE
ncbi:MAG: hypothetical protein JNL32_12415 [Candidatus Kapabacteria bacterium]|nr:hypothetical protein [Candidatus Kapabacteria bacterium]